MLKILGLVAALAAFPAHAETISAEIARSGLAATATRLAALPDPSDDDRLALGGVLFLKAIEGSFQTRWTYGLTDRTGFLPLLRLPTTDNPAPRPFEATVISTIFRDAEAGLATALGALDSIPDGSDAALEIALKDLWFDVNGDAHRDPGEDLVWIVGAASLGQGGPSADTTPTIRFDAADAAWLAAYCHLLSGVSDMVLAYDPSEPVGRILSARQSLAQWGPGAGDMILGGDRVPDSIDMLAMVLAALDQQPDAARMQAAHQHFLSMIAQNRRFWAQVDAETDNDREWLPNARQTSGLGVALPPETGAQWLAVLSDAEALLKGEKLIPYWRIGTTGGVNLNRIFTQPAPVDVAGWIQGWAAVPYVETGPLVSPENWRAFEAMMAGDAMLFAIWLN